MTRRPIFDAVRAALDRPLKQSEVDAVAAVLNEIGVPRDSQSYHLSDPRAFFTKVKEVTGSLDQEQVDITNGLLSGASHWPIGWLAYGLATAWHEARLKPIHEMGGPTYLSRYEGRADLGNTHKGDGVRFAGRGLVQLTGRRNYTAASEHLGVDLVADPDLALDPEIATKILIWGMEKGVFTGKSLSTYVSDNGSIPEWINARRIINGTDKAQLIAGYAEKFKNALQAGGWE